MKKALVLLGSVVLVGASCALAVAFLFAQRADYGWAPNLSRPEFTREHPRVAFDEGHNNASTAGFVGRYWPFARLLRADGYVLGRSAVKFSHERLEGTDVLVIANAAGAPKPQVFGINIPVVTDRRRSDPAFTPAEVVAVTSWVRAGGSLLLIADHAPFGESAQPLATALGVTMHKGFVEVPNEVSDPLVFSAENGRLGDHPVVRGDRPGTAIHTVMTYTGQSLSGPVGASPLLLLPPNAVEAVPARDDLVERPAGPAQGCAFELGRGRVVVLGEGGMATAQVARRVPYGINDPRNDNRQFVLNVMHWLSRRL
jgi:hypothetical protein